MSGGDVYRLTKREKEWVAASNDKPAALLCIRYALVYARRQPAWLLDECLPDMEYTSQINDNLRLGFDKTSKVFESRMTDPAWYPDSGALPLIQLATMPDGRPCGLVVQRKSRFDNGLGRPDFWMTFTTDADGKVAGMNSGFLPSPLELQCSGLFPGIPAALLAREKAHEPSVLPAGVPLRFLYVHLKDDPVWLTSAGVAKEALRFFNMASFEIYPLELDHSQLDNARWLFNKGVRALPHLHVMYGDEDILRLDGPFDRERLMNEWPVPKDLVSLPGSA
jgi:hypothetical protein